MCSVVYTPAQGDLEDHSVCRGRRSEVGHRLRTWRSPSSFFLCSGSVSSLSSPPCSLHRWCLLPRSLPPHWTPRHCFPRLQSFSFYDVCGCWTNGPSVFSSPLEKKNVRYKYNERSTPQKRNYLKQKDRKL